MKKEQRKQSTGNHLNKQSRYFSELEDMNSKIEKCQIKTAHWMDVMDLLQSTEEWKFRTTGKIENFKTSGKMK